MAIRELTWIGKHVNTRRGKNHQMSALGQRQEAAAPIYVTWNHVDQTPDTPAERGADKALPHPTAV